MAGVGSAARRHTVAGGVGSSSGASVVFWGLDGLVLGGAGRSQLWEAEWGSSCWMNVFMRIVRV